MTRIIRAIVLLLFLVVAVFQINSNPTGAPAGVAGGPADNGMTCFQNNCHPGAPAADTGLLSSNIAANGYKPDSTYTINVTVRGTGNKRFEISPQNGSGQYLGTLIAGGTSQVVGLHYITHRSAKSTNPATWTFTWKAPSAGSGDLTIYGVFAITRAKTKTQQLLFHEMIVDSTPVVKTDVASNIGPNSARLNGSINPRNKTKRSSFRFREAGGAWNLLNANPDSVFGNSFTSITVIAGGLKPKTNYSYQSCAWLTGDSIWGPVQNFITLSLTGLQDQERDLSSLILFPNPAQNESNISFTIKKAEQLSFCLITGDGKVIDIGSEKFYAGENVKHLDLSHLNAGFYKLRVKSGDEIWMKNLLVK